MHQALEDKKDNYILNIKDTVKVTERKMKSAATVK